jgi:hypothetical protein
MSKEDYLRGTWDQHHKDNHRNYVTGSDIASIDTFHKLPTLSPGQTFLDIGVGFGVGVKHYKDLGCKTIGVDVSQGALNNCKEFCDHTYLSKDLKKCEPADLALCHLVVQHNHVDEVTRIINDTQLKEEGVLSIQFASLNIEKSVNRLSKDIISRLNESLLYFYEIDQMRAIVSRTNKEIVDHSGPFWFDGIYCFDWHTLKLKNKR